MKTVTLASDLEVSQISYGCMRMLRHWEPADISPDDRSHGRMMMSKALDLGITFFDTADIYSHGEAEVEMGAWLKEDPSRRDRIQLVTKCGVRFKDDLGPSRYDLSKEYIIRACEASLRRLGIETIDLYLLHRPDDLMNPEEVAEAFDYLFESGKVRYFGVSNFEPSRVAMLDAFIMQPLLVNQVEFSLAHRAPMEDGTLHQCMERGMTCMAWSPLAGGSLSAMADKALAWLLKLPTPVIPVVGTANPSNLENLVAASQSELSREEWYQLLIAARGTPMP